MATAVLPARDYLASSYQENQSGRSGMVYSSGQKLYQSKRKLIGGNQDYGKRRLDPQFVATAKSCHIEKKWNFLSRSTSFVAADKRSPGISSVHSTPSVPSDLSDLARPSSTPPVLNTNQLSLESISHGYRSVRTSGEHNVAKHTLPNNLQGAAAGKPNGGFSQSSDSRRFSKNKGCEDSQTELGKGADKNLRAVSVLGKNEIAFRKDSMIDRRTDKKPGKNLVMGQVTILKRGETFKGFVETESDSVNHQIERCERPSGFLKEDGAAKKALATSQPLKSKTTGASRFVPKVCFSDTKSEEGNGGKPHKLADDLVITSTERLGPDPSVLPKEGSGILRSVSSGISVTDVVGGDLAMLAPGFGSGTASEELDCMKAVSDEDVKGSPFLVFETEKWSGPAFSNSPPPSCLPLPKFFVRQQTTTQVGVNTFATRNLRRLLGLD